MSENFCVSEFSDNLATQVREFSRRNLAFNKLAIGRAVEEDQSKFTTTGPKSFVEILKEYSEMNSKLIELRGVKIISLRLKNK